MHVFFHVSFILYTHHFTSTRSLQFKLLTKTMSKTSRVMAVLSYLVIFIICLELPVNIVSGRVKNEVNGPAAQVVKKDERTTVFESKFGSISTVDIDDGTGRNNYHLQFINLEPNALFLPVLLHSDMVFYVRSGNGILSWTEDEKMNKVNLQRGDLYRLQSGTLFYLNSNNTNTSWTVTPSLRIVAIFADPDEEQLQGPSVGPYSSINELVRGFDDPVLQSAFQVPEEVIQELTNAADTAVIVSADQQSQEEEEFPYVNAMFGIQRLSMRASENKKKKHTKTFNFFKEEPDFENCNGWGKFVSKHDLRALRDSQIGVYMVNITPGSMMGPHWNPFATEVSVVLEGEGMVQVVCASSLTNKDCKNTRVRVEEGDVFTVPRFHPVAQMSFNSGSLVFMGFSSTSKKDKPQFLVGKGSFLHKLDQGILGVAFNVSNTTIGQLTSVKKKSILLQDCTSCAEEQEGISEEERATGRRGEGEGEAEEGKGESGDRRQEEERRERQEEGGRSEEESKEEMGRREETGEEEERQREEDRREEERRQREEEKREEERRERQEEGGRSEGESGEEKGRGEETKEDEERQREEERREIREESERREEEFEEEMGRRPKREGEEVEWQGEEEEAGRGWL